jgi:hypothetical protein
MMGLGSPPSFLIGGCIAGEFAQHPWIGEKTSGLGHGARELRFLAAPPPTPERMTAVLAQVHEVVRAADDDLDLDPALAACVQLSLAGPHLAGR